TGGGSGHLPGFLGYVGEGLCSGVAVGNVFSSPSAEQILEATKAVNGGAGVLYVYGNYGGDVLNFDLAADLAEPDGIETQTVVLTDDVASAPKERAADRRGVAGMLFAFKCAGAAAERGDSLDEVARICGKANANCRTMGVGLSPTILPAAGKPTFTLPEGEMEIGIGIHGEPGTHRGNLESADAIAERITREILDDLDAEKGSRVALLVNGLGATPLEELYLLYRRSARLVADRGLKVARSYVGEYVTSLEMAGASITVMLLDDELQALLEAPANSPFFRDGTPS
ncbi:dihydroxyacetone kinase subunit DhaK, partial [Paraburkholderia caledonica]